MEIAFLQLPETKLVPEAPQASSSAEFSMLLASMLGQAGPEVSFNVPVDGSPEADVQVEDREAVSGQEADGAPERAQSQKSDASVLTGVPEAPASALSASVLAPLFAPVEKTATTAAPMTAESDTASLIASGNEIDLKAPLNPVRGFGADRRPSHEENTGAPVELGALENLTQPFAPVAPEKAVAAQVRDEKVTHDLKSPEGFSIEHFEVEIPAEAIMRHAAAEEPAEVSAAHAKAPDAHALPEAPVQAEMAKILTGPLPDEFSLPTLEDAEPMETVKLEEPMGAEKHGREAVDAAFEFNNDHNEREDLGNDGEEQAGLAGSESRLGLEPRSDAAERALSPLSFEKMVEGPLKEASSQPARLSPATAEVHEKVQAGIKLSADSGGGEVRMKLNPDSLGEVRIKLNVDSGVVKAEIIVENMEVKRIIESDSSFLKESLGAHGLTLDKCVVEVGRSFDARGREGDGNDTPAGGEQRPPRDREQEKGGTPWQRRYRQDHGRQEDGGVDFFI